MCLKKYESAVIFFSSLSVWNWSWRRNTQYTALNQIPSHYVKRQQYNELLRDRTQRRRWKKSREKSHNSLIFSSLLKMYRKINFYFLLARQINNGNVWSRSRVFGSLKRRISFCLAKAKSIANDGKNQWSVRKKNSSPRARTHTRSKHEC